MLAQQTAWLNVPAVQTVGCGQFRSAIPNARSSLALFALLAECAQADGENFALATLDLSDGHPLPTAKQPLVTVSPLNYLISDWLLPWLTRRTYHKEFP